MSDSAVLKKLEKLEKLLRLLDDRPNLVAVQTTVTKRLAALERKFAALSRKLSQSKDWRRAVGMLRDTKLAREADELGRRYRAQQTKP